MIRVSNPHSAQTKNMNIVPCYPRCSERKGHSTATGHLSFARRHKLQASRRRMRARWDNTAKFRGTFASQFIMTVCPIFVPPSSTNRTGISLYGFFVATRAASTCRQRQRRSWREIGHAPSVQYALSPQQGCKSNAARSSILTVGLAKLQRCQG